MSDTKKEKTATVVNMKQKQESPVGIPFGKPARLGNFRVWRSKLIVGKGKTKSDIECINLSNLDGTWLVRIPQTFEMFGMLTVAYQWANSENAEERRRGDGFIRTALSNMAYVSMICNGFFHHGVEMVTAAYANPSLLNDTEEVKNFMLDAKDTIKRFLVWREEYERHVSENEPTEQDLHQEDLAEQAADILTQNGNK